MKVLQILFCILFYLYNSLNVIARTIDVATFTFADKTWPSQIVIHKSSLSATSSIAIALWTSCINCGESSNQQLLWSLSSSSNYPNYNIWSTPVVIQNGIRANGLQLNSIQGLVSNQNGILLLFYPSPLDTYGFRVARSYDIGNTFTEIIPSISGTVNGGLGGTTNSNEDQQWSGTYDANLNKWILLIGPDSSASTPTWEFYYSVNDGVSWEESSISGISDFPSASTITGLSLQVLPNSGMILSFSSSDQTQILNFYSTTGSTWISLNPIVLSTDTLTIWSIIGKHDPKTHLYTIQSLTRDISTDIATVYVITISSLEIISNPSEAEWMDIEALYSFQMSVPSQILFSSLSNDKNGHWLSILHYNDQAGNNLPYFENTRTDPSNLWTSQTNMTTLVSSSDTNLINEINFMTEFITGSDRWIQIYINPGNSGGIRILTQGSLFSTKAPTISPILSPTTMPTPIKGTDAIHLTNLQIIALSTIAGIIVPVIVIAGVNVLYHIIKYGDDMSGYKKIP